MKRTREERMSWPSSSKEEKAASQRRYYLKNRAKVLATNKRWRNANPSQVKVIAARRKEHRAKYYQDVIKLRKKADPSRFYAIKVKHEAAKLKATVVCPENDEILGLIYAEARHRGLEVDHIVPLQGRRVCGLHVYYNTQLLTRRQNAMKSNTFP